MSRADDMIDRLLREKKEEELQKPSFTGGASGSWDEASILAPQPVPRKPAEVLAPLAAEPIAEPQAMNPEVKDYIMKKFDLGNFSDENRQKLVDESKPTIGTKVQAALAALGAGFMGKDASAAGSAVLSRQKDEADDKLAAFDKGRANKIQEYGLDRQISKDEREDKERSEAMDPMSERSKAAQAMMIEDLGMDPKIAAKLSAKQIEERIPTLKIKLDQRNKERQFRIDEAKATGEKGKKTMEDKKMGSYVTEGLRGSQGMRAALNNGDNTFSMVGDNDFTRNLDRMAENFGRMQSGGAINKDEEARFKRMAPGPTDSAEQQQKKLDALDVMFRERAKIYGVDLDSAGLSGTSAVASGPKPKWAK